MDLASLPRGREAGFEDCGRRLSGERDAGAAERIEHVARKHVRQASVHYVSLVRQPGGRHHAARAHVVRQREGDDLVEPEHVEGDATPAGR